MKKYDKKIIYDYIMGNDLGEYSSEELEDNKEFMIDVIEKTNDKRMYNLCSNNVRLDYEFVKYIVLKFRDDVDFIKKVADNYLNNIGVDNDYERVELLTIMSSLTNCFDYNFMLDAVYSGKRLSIELYNVKNKDNKDDFNLGMGCVVIYDSYHGSEIILKYFAKKMIEEIFSEFDIDLEGKLHAEFKNSTDIDEIGVNTYMISFIQKYDSMLASFASSHIEVLESFSKKIKNIKNNWNSFNTKEESEKYKLMITKVLNYLSSVDSIFGDVTLLYYFGKKFEVIDKIIKYDNNDDTLYNIMNEGGELSEDSIKSTLELAPNEVFYYNAVKKMMVDTIYGKDTSNNNNDNKPNSKVLKIKFRQE